MSRAIATDCCLNGHVTSVCSEGTMRLPHTFGSIADVAVLDGHHVKVDLAGLVAMLLVEH